jgi:SAM-dependent methyltransferase
VRGSSIALYDALAPDYEQHFTEPHRRAYDDLAWESVLSALPPSPSCIVDAGAGVGRWSVRLLDLGYEVIAIEQAPAMLARLSQLRSRPGFSMISADMATVDLAPESVDAVIAMGSIQYTDDPAAMLARMTDWLRTGATISIVVDSLQGLVVELLRAGRIDEAIDRAQTKVGRWQQRGLTADMHLFSADDLERLLADAGVDAIAVKGLLVGASLVGVSALTERLRDDYDTQLATERTLSDVRDFADLGKQLLAIGRCR